MGEKEEAARLYVLELRDRIEELEKENKRLTVEIIAKFGRVGG